MRACGRETETETWLSHTRARTLKKFCLEKPERCTRQTNQAVVNHSLSVLLSAVLFPFAGSNSPEILRRPTRVTPMYDRHRKLRAKFHFFYLIGLGHRQTIFSLINKCKRRRRCPVPSSSRHRPVIVPSSVIKSWRVTSSGK